MDLGRSKTLPAIVALCLCSYSFLADTCLSEDTNRADSSNHIPVSVRYRFRTIPIAQIIDAIRFDRILGWSSIAGLSTIVIAYAVIRSLAKRSLALTRALMATTDRRISVISELVSAIRFLKYYAWEKVSLDLSGTATYVC